MTTGKRIATAMTLLTLGAAALAADPPYYAKKATWQETMQASREALTAWEAEEAKKAELAGKPAPTAKVGKCEFGLWFEIGPFVEAGKDGFDFAFPPEKEIELSKAYGNLKWRRISAADGEVHDLSCPGDGAIYFTRTITAARAQKLTTYYGSDDGLAVWCNGKKVISNKVPRGVAANQDTARLDLVKGENHLLIKIWNRGGGCGWYFSATGKAAKPRKNDPRELAREQLWDLLRRDFTAPDARRQMDWESTDNIWAADWTAGKLAELARRYVAPARGTQAGSEVAKLAPAADSPAGLAKVRTLYYQGKLVQETLAQLKDLNFRAVRLAVEDLTKTFGDRYPKGPEYLRRLGEMEKAVLAAAEADGQSAAQLDIAQKFLALRREALLANPLLDFEKLLVVKRNMRSPKLGLPQNWQGNCALPRSGFDNEIAVVDMKDPSGALRTLYRPEQPVFVGDVDLHFDGEKLMFSSIGTHDRWQIFEVGTDGKDTRQITPGNNPDVDNYDSVYLPDERILLASTRCFTGVPCVGGGNQVANLYLMNADRDANTLRQVTFEQDHNWCPTVMPDGRVMYARWEYSDAPHYFSRLMFTMNPDGTQQLALYGSNSYWPNSIFYARPCPGHPTRFAAVISGHHGVPRMGEMILFDPAKGRHEVSGVVQRIPGYGQEVEPVIQDGLVNGSWPRFLHPWPLSDKYFLASCQKSSKDTWDLYLVDTFDNMVPLRVEPGYAILEPVPLKATPRPPVIPDKVDLKRKDAILYVADVHKGPGLAGVPRGTVKKLRVYAFHYAFYRMGGHISIGVDGPWDVHRILGTVPVEADGSAMFRVPANTPIALQPLDEDGKGLQLMRSWLTAMPGEFLSCAGCHEQNADTATIRFHQATAREPAEITPWYGPARGFSFEREVQPVLDKYCVSCHDGKRKGLPDFRRDGTTPKFRNFSPSYLALHPYVRRPGPESDYHMMSPLEYHADSSELVQMLRKGHGRVKLDAEAWDRLITWIDLNVPDKGTWGESRGIAGDIHDRRLEMARKYACVQADPEAVVAGPTGEVVPVKPGPPPTRPTETVTAAGWPFGPDEAKRRQAAAGQRAELTIDLGEGQKLDLALIPGGEFVLGDVGPGATPDEWPLTKVRIDKPLWMGKFEITNAQYRLFDPTHDSQYISVYNKDQGNRGEAANRETQPVIRISWQEAMAFCQWLSARTGLTFSLPTEAQWEHACRAGTDTPMNYGPVDADFGKFANLADGRVLNLCRRDSPKWIPCVESVNDGSIITDNVGKYLPNAWGLHDMHGNVSEWTLSTYKPYPYHAADGRDAPSPDGRKVVRGGSFYDRPMRGRSSFRLDYPSWQRVYHVGFRVACEAEPKTLVAAGKAPGGK